jgi:hypothetical protein
MRMICIIYFGELIVAPARSSRGALRRQHLAKILTFYHALHASMFLVSKDLREQLPRVNYGFEGSSRTIATTSAITAQGLTYAINL